MKRSEFLVPLSWEHHSALVNANRIKLGVLNGGKVEDIREFIVYIWQHDLFPHFEREERVILGHQEAAKLPAEIKEQVLKEHERFADIFDRIGRGDVQTELMGYFKTFADLLISHVRFEESSFFPAVEKVFSGESLREIGKTLRAQHVPGCITWQPVFWKKQK